ncbi:hypothetical protein J3459_008557 [Metarhizium acridum]|nr:hypothetical protein J3459_008557 [Metarhizium acridum]
MLVYEAGRRGMHVKVYRPGTISGHSLTGATNTYDLLNALIVESLHLGYAPKVDGWLAEMTPVDFKLYHLGDPNPVTAENVFQDLEALGYPTKRLPWDDWVALWKEKRGSGRGGDDPFTVDILRGGMPTVDTLELVTILSDEATKPALDLYGVSRPKIDRNLWETYARHSLLVAGSHDRHCV